MLGFWARFFMGGCLFVFFGGTPPQKKMVVGANLGYTLRIASSPLDTKVLDQDQVGMSRSGFLR